jgi:catechol 2,3-dioxygenase-like lactoylglutathione lyase family enzyme
MLRGMSTVNLWADDLPAATRRYTELLGVEPYFTSEAAGRGPGYVEFRIGDYQHELGIMYNRHYRRPGQPLMTNRPASAQRLRDLAWLR